MTEPLVVSMEMGYGHLRAAHALAEALDTEVLHADRPPLAGGDEQALWETARRLYEWTSRAAQLPLIGRPISALLDAVTAIPHPRVRRDLSRPNSAVRALAGLFDRGMGEGLARRLAEERRPLLTTYFVPALAVDRARLRGAEGVGPPDGPPLNCVVTDTDLARAWVAERPAESRIRYLVPSQRAVRRLRAYGVPAERVRRTGFPLPGELLGGPHLETLRADLARRLVRLDPAGDFHHDYRSEVDELLGPLPRDGQAGHPPTVAFVVGGAGAQTDIAEAALPSLAPLVRAGRLRLTLVAGARREVAEDFTRWARKAGLDDHLGRLADGAAVEVVVEDTVAAYFRRFNRLLHGVDALWTKPSELTFFGALGLPLVLAPPLGVQERYNRRWARRLRACVKQGKPERAAEWLPRWLEDGTLAAAAWNGFVRLPKYGLYQILEEVGAQPDGAGGDRIDA